MGYFADNPVGGVFQWPFEYGKTSVYMLYVRCQSHYLLPPEAQPVLIKVIFKTHVCVYDNCNRVLRYI